MVLYTGVPSHKGGTHRARGLGALAVVRGELTFPFDKKGILWLLKIEFMRHFLKIEVTAFKHEVFGSPMWVQEIYQTFEDYLKERGKPLTRGL
jgi:hypothetical protein